MAITGIEHVAIVSHDTAALKDWYMKVFGGKVVYDNGKGTYFLQFEDVEKSAGIRHLAFSVTSEAFDEIVPVLKADERVTEVHDVSENAKGLKTYWFRDIEDNFAHLIYRPTPLS
jgi:catechol 2,3-dioxygenase-like lactoylglutathione lyase family enzyme